MMARAGTGVLMMQGALGPILAAEQPGTGLQRPPGVLPRTRMLPALSVVLQAGALSSCDRRLALVMWSM